MTIRRPNPLAMTIRAELAEATVREGCIGETISALVAAEDLDATTDPEARAALARIRDDEARHAELAFRAVRWALAEGGGDVRAAVERAFGQAPRAHRDVFGPCGRALLDGGDLHTPAAGALDGVTPAS